jgi:DNA-binding MarR family transcriptional regulator
MNKKASAQEKLSSELYLNFQKIFRCLNFGRNLKGKPPSITGTQMRVLSFFNETDVVYISEISRVLGMSIQSVNNIIARLESVGLVERSRNKHDKRLSDIRLTARGIKGLNAFRDGQLESLKGILNKLEPEQRKTLNASIENATLILEKVALKSATHK